MKMIQAPDGTWIWPFPKEGEDLCFGRRINSILFKNGIRGLPDLIENYEHVLKFDGIGKKSIKYIEYVLEKKCMNLKNEKAGAANTD